MAAEERRPIDGEYDRLIEKGNKLIAEANKVPLPEIPPQPPVGDDQQPYVDSLKKYGEAVVQNAKQKQIVDDNI